MFPFVSNAHVYAPPAATSDAVPPNDAVAVGVSASDDAVVPRRPSENCPQHHAMPSTEIAQECVPPISILAIVNQAGINDVYTGVVTAAVPHVLLPNCPLLLRPQHCNLLSDKTAHVVDPPAAIMVAVEPRFT